MLVVLCLAVLLPCSALSVDVTFQIPRSSLDLRKRLNVSETFLELLRCWHWALFEVFFVFFKVSFFLLEVQKSFCSE